MLVWIFAVIVSLGVLFSSFIVFTGNVFSLVDKDFRRRATSNATTYFLQLAQLEVRVGNIRFVPGNGHETERDVAGHGDSYGVFTSQDSAPQLEIKSTILYEEEDDTGKVGDVSSEVRIESAVPARFPAPPTNP